MHVFQLYTLQENYVGTHIHMHARMHAHTQPWGLEYEKFTCHIYFFHHSNPFLVLKGEGYPHSPVSQSYNLPAAAF